MSQEDVEMVRASIDAWNRGNWDATLKDGAPSFEFDFSRSVGPGRAVYSLDQMRGFFHELDESWESLRIEVDEFIEAGEHIVTPNTLYVRGRDGIEVQARAAWVWTIRDGSITRLCFYQERQDALEAIGLSEQDAHADS
jgi:ketosteroid isomerase-like protein